MVQSSFRRMILTLVTVAVFGGAVASQGAAVTLSTSVMTTGKTTNAVTKKYCTAAQAKRKRAGQRVNCVVRPKVCTKLVSGKRVRVKCPVRKPVATPRTAAPTAAIHLLRTYVDENGANDGGGPGSQSDLTSTSVDSTVSQLLVTVNWDNLTQTGSNSADACFLFDSDGDGKVNTAICVSWRNTRVLQSVTKYTCSDVNIDRCSQPSAPITLSNSLCTMSLGTDPFPTGTSAPDDARASCTFDFTLLTSGGTISTLVNTCSFNSGEPNSNPVDCVLIPRDGFLKLTKVLNAAGSGYTGPFTIGYTCTITVSGKTTTITGSESVAGNASVTIGMPAGFACTASETLPTPPTGYVWSATSPQISAPVTITSAQIATLTVTNTLQALPASLTITKVLTQDNGGAKAFTDFGFKINNGTTTAFEADGSNTVSVTAGTYTVTEPAAAGYTTTYSGCTSIVLPPGGSATCTITNNDIAPSLTLIKKVTNDNGGQLTVADFPLTAAGTKSGNTITGTGTVTSPATLKADTFTLSEVTRPEYTASAWVCTGTGTQNGSTIGLGLGQSATCTITNDDKPGTLIVKKIVDNQFGGTKVAGDFSFKVGTAAAVAFDPTDGINEVQVNAGTYTVTEPAVAGYQASYNNCANVVVANGETKTCTITNSDLPVTIVVKKVVINDDGGTKQPSDFTFSLDGAAAVPFTNVDATHGEDTFTNQQSGNHTVVETADSGYTTTYSGCDLTGVALGATVTCTITNDDKPATLIVKKVVINQYGGTKTAADFQFKIGDADAVSFDASGTNEVQVLPGTYTITEPAVTGYEASYAGCDQVSITNGETKTCTITNSDLPVTIVVKKVVINDDGGTKQPSDFTFSLDGAAAVPFTNVDATHGEDTFTNQQSGNHTVVETADSGYTTTYSGCDLTGVALGATVTCTITNDDKPVTVTVEKIVINDSGGTKTAGDFAFTVDGGTPISFEENQAEPQTGKATITVSANAEHTIAEVADAGYAATLQGCDPISATNGAAVTCIITNNDKPATLTVTKTVINDNGGTKTAGDFGFAYSGHPSALPFIEVPGNPLQGQNVLTVDAGTYTVTEPAAAGYTTTTNNCSNIVLANGASATCAITNDDQAATLIVKKVLDLQNGGTATASDFSFTTTDGGTPVQFEADGQNDLTVNAGSYNVTETAAPGYNATYEGCADLTIANGATVTCTITNHDLPGTLIVEKTVINDNGGTKTAGDFSFTYTGHPAAVNFTELADTSKGKNVIAVPAGTYNVAETADIGYQATAVNCDNIVIANGETKTCSITNDDKQGALVITKQVVNDDGGNLVATDFGYTLDGAAAVGFTATADALVGTSGVLPLDAGSYAVGETATPGYAAQNGCATVTVQNGQTAECTITNNDIAPKLTLEKIVNGGPAGAAGQFDLSAKAETSARDIVDQPGDEPVATAVFANEPYQLSEAGPAGYDPAGPWVCADAGEVAAPMFSMDGNLVILKPGADVVCTITNNFRDLKLTKTTDKQSYVPGNTIQYTVTVTNVGAATIASGDIAVTDTMLGEGLVLSGEPTDMAPGDTRTYTGTRVVTSRDCGTITNVATVSVVRDGNTANNTATVNSPVICSADLSLAKSADKATYKPGDTITYTLTVKNVGTSIVPVAAIAASDPSLTNLAIQANAPTELEPGQSVTYTGTKVATKAMCGPVVNTATVSFEGDTNSENDTASVTVSVAGGTCIIIEGPKPTTLRIDKIGPKTAKQGKYVTYTLKITNIGKFEAVNTVISDPLPKGMTLKFVPSGATLRAGGIVTWKVSRLAPGKSRIVTIVLRSTGTKTLTRCNIGRARADNAPLVSDRACTKFAQVAGTNVPGVTG